MVKTFERECVKDYVIEDETTGEKVELKSGENYTTSRLLSKNILVVFHKKWWVACPANIFKVEE